jgi:hypothetical protein
MADSFPRRFAFRKAAACPDRAIFTDELVWGKQKALIPYMGQEHNACGTTQIDRDHEARPT